MDFAKPKITAVAIASDARMWLCFHFTKSMLFIDYCVAVYRLSDLYIPILKIKYRLTLMILLLLLLLLLLLMNSNILLVIYGRRGWWLFGLWNHLLRMNHIELIRLNSLNLLLLLLKNVNRGWLHHIGSLLLMNQLHLQLLLILQKLLLMQLSHCWGLNLQFLDAFDDFDSMEAHTDPEVRLQILISDVIQKGAIYA